MGKSVKSKEYPKRSRILDSLFLLFFGFALKPANADFAPCHKTLTPYEAMYMSTYKGITMSGARSLRSKGENQYALTHAAKKTGSSISEQSIFTLKNNRIKVEKYDMSRSALGIKREYHNRYDWQKQEARVTGHANVTLPLNNHPLDLLSYQLALRCDLEQEQKQLNYPVIARNRIKNYEFKVSGKETLKTEVGELQTLIVDRLRKGDGRTTRIWVAPDLNYLIVRLEQSESKDNASYKLEIKAVSFK